MSASAALAGETSIGGTVKSWLYDKSDGHVDYWTTVDGEPMGYYAKAFYSVTAEFRLMAGYSHSEANWVGDDEMDESYDEMLVGAQYFLGDGVTAMLNFSKTDGERTLVDGARDADEHDEATLEYTRITLGVRATF